MPRRPLRVRGERAAGLRISDRSRPGEPPVEAAAGRDQARSETPPGHNRRSPPGAAAPARRATSEPPFLPAQRPERTTAPDRHRCSPGPGQTASRPARRSSLREERGTHQPCRVPFRMASTFPPPKKRSAPSTSGPGPRPTTAHQSSRRAWPPHELLPADVSAHVPQPLARLRKRRVAQLGQPEVEQLHHAARCEEDIYRLDAPSDDPTGVERPPRRRTICRARAPGPPRARDASYRGHGPGLTCVIAHGDRRPALRVLADLVQSARGRVVDEPRPPRPRPGSIDEPQSSLPGGRGEASSPSLPAEPLSTARCTTPMPPTPSGLFDPGSGAPAARAPSLPRRQLMHPPRDAARARDGINDVHSASKKAERLPSLIPSSRRQPHAHAQIVPSRRTTNAAHFAGRESTLSLEAAPPGSPRARSGILLALRASRDRT